MQRALPIFAATLAGVVTGAGLMWLAIGERAPQTIIVETRQMPVLSAGESFSPPVTDAPSLPPAGTSGTPARTPMVLQNVAIGQTVIATSPATEEPAGGESGAVQRSSSTPAMSTGLQTIALRETRLISLAPPVVAPGATPKAASAGSIDDALSFALEAADPYLKEGFTIREDYWGGDLPVKQSKAIAHQLFKGNEYWFWMGTCNPNAKPRLAVYDSDGKLVSAETWERRHMCAARVVPQKTGAYYLTVEFAEVSATTPTTDHRSFWALAYGYH